MASRYEVRSGTDDRSTDDRGKPERRTLARGIFTAAALLTLAWFVAVILMARWLIVTIF
jgi:hypothetical protein